MGLRRRFVGDHQGILELLDTVAQNLEDGVALIQAGLCGLQSNRASINLPPEVPVQVAKIITGRLRSSCVDHIWEAADASTEVSSALGISAQVGRDARDLALNGLGVDQLEVGEELVSSLREIGIHQTLEVLILLHGLRIRLLRQAQVASSASLSAPS